MCETRGVPKPLPQITWYKDDKRVRNSRHFYIIVSFMDLVIFSFCSCKTLIDKQFIILTNTVTSLSLSKSLRSSIKGFFFQILFQEDRPEWRTGYTSSTLVIMKFVPRHQANYTCVATNTFRAKRRQFRIEGKIVLFIHQFLLCIHN